MRRSAAILLLVCLAGCATSPSDGPGAVSRGGEQFGVVDGTFRGRWWNHYERGRSYLDGGFHAEAAADFQTALALRAEDQRWARTYGLHFIPEYFPNRELGIVRYNEGQLEEAARLLERSLAQERTALAAHYLDLVRAKQVSDAGGDSIPPEVSTSVMGEGTQAQYHIEVKDNTYVARVVVNGNPLPLAQAMKSATFTIPLTFQTGYNRIDVYVTDIAGNTEHVLNQILHDLDGPAVSFDGLAGGSISGLISDSSELQEFSVDGRRIPIAAAEEHTWRFTGSAQGGEAFRAVDKHGNITTGRVPHADETRAGLTRRVQLAANGLPQLAQDAAPGAGVRLTNLAPGQRYLMDEIVVAIEASDPDGIASITLDDVPLSGIVPGAKMQFLSRRIRLEAMGSHAVRAVLVDAKGETSEAAVEIERAPTDIERPEERLRVALLGNLWEGAGPKLENEADFVAEELTGALFKRGRVDVVSRDALPRVLEEQELRTVLGSRDIAPGLRQIVPADVLVVGKVRRTGDTMEIVLQAVSSETSHILGYADVAGVVATLDDLRALVRDLALRFEQEFPRVSGLVVNVPADDRCFTTLTEADRVRPELPCIVYRFGDPIIHPGTGAVLGRPTQIVARGTLDEVQRQMSRVTLSAPGAVQVNDHVATR